MGNPGRDLCHLRLASEHPSRPSFLTVLFLRVQELQRAMGEQEFCRPQSYLTGDSRRVRAIHRQDDVD